MLLRSDNDDANQAETGGLYMRNIQNFRRQITILVVGITLLSLVGGVLISKQVLLILRWLAK